MRFRFDPEAIHKDGTKGAMVPIDADYVDPTSIGGRTSDAEIYRNAQMPDGADVSSRSKYMRYLKEHDSAPLSDFKGAQAKQVAHQRAVHEIAVKGNTKVEFRDKERRADIVKAYRQLKKY